MNTIEIISNFGYMGVAMMIFLESGLFLFFFPGDTLLFTAGFLASAGILSLPVLLIIIIAMTILGGMSGFVLGKTLGIRIKDNPKKFFLNAQRIEKTEKFFALYGSKTILIARFIPVVRTFAPLFAGIAQMKYKTFAFFNIIGGVIWSTLLLSMGYFLGKIFPESEKYLSFFIIGIFVISFIPAMIEYYKSKKV